MTKKDFRGEVWNNIDPIVLQNIVKINDEAVDGKVGHDSFTKKATEYLQSFFDEKIDVLYTINGTAANIIALKGMLSSYGTVICAEQTHINTYECGALEYNLGNKILSIPTQDGKINSDMVESLLIEHASHQYIPQVIAITQPTELGAVYTLEEITAITTYAHKHGMKVFIDGARLGSALATLKVDLRQMMAKTGVDVFTVGGTKAGAMFGEAVVFTKSNQLIAGEYILKQSMQHFDKSKFLGAQMLSLFDGDRWISNFDNANKMAKLLEKKFIEKGIKIYLPVESNVVFCVLEEDVLSKINTEFDLKYWFKDKKVVRLVTSFATTEIDVNALIALI
ncbi:MAG: aminotransferase class V-fold PLP-dependent enzyme [Clostridia bacterium]|nr:aminotransferase class V-fold PLP-dependent enzyme [Clostridia bacterium]